VADRIDENDSATEPAAADPSPHPTEEPAAPELGTPPEDTPEPPAETPEPAAEAPESPVEDETPDDVAGTDPAAADEPDGEAPAESVAESVAEPEPEPAAEAAAEESAPPKRTKKGKPVMPSWDEVLLGVRGQR
jgi:hypothetical protein